MFNTLEIREDNDKELGSKYLEKRDYPSHKSSTYLSI